MAIGKGRISRLYVRIIACFILIVVFSVCVLIFAFLWFSNQNERQYLDRLDASVNSATQRLNESVLSAYDLCTMVSENALVKENFKPYDRLTADNLYYYPSIVELLRQSRLQFDGIVDSVFLYADQKRVLYSMNEKGMANMDAFFSGFMHYKTYDEAYWEALLSETGSRVAILSADTYETRRVNDARAVIPLVYLSTALGHPNILVMNLSLDKIHNMYADGAGDENSTVLLFDRDGRLLIGPDDAPDASALLHQTRVTYRADACFVTCAEQTALGVVICRLTPIAAYQNMSAYFRFTAIGLTSVFVLCGLILALFMSNRTYAPIREVGENVRSAQDAQEGGAAVSYLTDELAQIKDGINRLASDRERFKARNRQHSYHYVTQGLSTLLDGRALGDEAYFTGLLEQDYGFQKRGYRCADVMLDMLQKNDYQTREELLERLTNTLLNAFENGPALVWTHWRDNMLVLLIDSDGQDEALCRACLKRAAKEFTDAGACALRMGLGGTARSLNDIGESFEEANSEVFALPGEDTLPLGGDEPFVYDRAEILSAANTRDLKNIEDAAEEILTAAKRRGVSYREAENIVRDIYDTVMDAQRRFAPDPAVAPRAEEPFSVPEVLILSPDINLSPLLVALFHSIPYQTGRGEKGAEDIARRLKKTIDEHYAEEMSLEILADKVGVSAKYLSRVFKQSMGVNLSDYLAYVRVERVKELLKGDLPLEKIAEQVGIGNRTTFTRTFRKFEGVTPGEWRAVQKNARP